MQPIYLIIKLNTMAGSAEYKENEYTLDDIFTQTKIKKSLITASVINGGPLIQIFAVMRHLPSGSKEHHPLQCIKDHYMIGAVYTKYSSKAGDNPITQYQFKLHEEYLEQREYNPNLL